LLELVDGSLACFGVNLGRVGFGLTFSTSFGVGGSLATVGFAFDCGVGVLDVSPRDSAGATRLRRIV